MCKTPYLQDRGCRLVSKLIAVWGSQNSGKTTFTVKLALSIYEHYQATVLVLHTDNQTPTLPALFPNYKADNLYSIGVPLSKTTVTQDDVIANIVTVKGKQNLGFLGFKDGENKYTYPAYDEKKVETLLTILESLANFVIVDCTSALDDNVLSAMAVQQADEVIRLVTPNLKCMSYCASQLPLYANAQYRLERQLVGLNITDNDVILPIEEAKAHFNEVNFTIPYCRKVKEQWLGGQLLEPVPDKKYNAKLKAIAEKMV